MRVSGSGRCEEAGQYARIGEGNGEGTHGVPHNEAGRDAEKTQSDSECVVVVRPVLGGPLRDDKDTKDVVSQSS
jgi:hypothetical protein